MRTRFSADHSPHTTVVNAGVLPHPLTGSETVAFVAAGGTRKLAHLRADPTIAVVVRAGWRWTAVGCVTNAEPPSL